MRRSSRTRAALTAAILALGGVAAVGYAHPALGGRAREAPAPPTLLGDQDPRSATGRRAAMSGARPNSFYFTRAVYSDGRGGWGYRRGGRSWMTDYPKADRQFLAVLTRLSNIDAYEYEHPVAFDDPEVRRFPFLYAVEVGNMLLTDTEIAGLRDYLLAGGFLMVDDFWGTYEWRQFEDQMARVFPEYPIVEIPLDHEVFHTYYDIEEVVQVPNVGNGMRGGPTFENDGYEAHLRGIFDHEGRLMVVVNWNTDLGDAWEWAEQPDYPLKFSTYAYQMAVNFIVYAMSH